MPRPRKDVPTDGELEILETLWTLGPSTVREVHRALSEHRETGYTTVLKLMQIMSDKGWVTVDRSVRPQVYRPSEERAETQRRLIGDLVDRAFAGSSGSLALRALSTKRATAEERRRIREMLDRQERESE
jgi:predicted transcriptional regulator